MNPEELFNKAYDLHCAKRFVEALAMYKELVAKYPDCKRAPVARQQIKNLREFDKPPPRDSQAERSHQAHSEREQSTIATFKCVRCSILIRLTLPPSGDFFRCAQCKHGYAIVRASAVPLAILLVPDVIREVHQPPQQETRRYPQKVRDAFAVLGLEPTEDMQVLKRTFRDMVGQYHPDKVAHLGKDLRRLAEEKTKALVMAFQVIETYLEK